MIEMTWSTPTPHVPAQRLGYIEQLLVQSLRKWVADRNCWPNIVLEFNRACGPHAATTVCEALESVFHNLGVNARRRIRLHRPVCCLISPDEVCVLNLIAAVQTQDPVRVRALTEWLVPKRAAEVLEADIDTIARGLAESGYTFPVRANRACPRVPTEGVKIQAVQ